MNAPLAASVASFVANVRDAISRFTVRRGRLIIVAIPLLWLTLFFLLPFFVVFKISVSEALIAQPPYAPLVAVAPDGRIRILVNLANYAFLFEDALYVSAYLESITIALISTAGCLALGYPVALYIARTPQPRQSVLLMLVVLPFWTSFLLRVYAWIGIIKDNGLVNNVLMAVGLTTAPIQIIQTDTAVVIGIVYTYLPFMVLPIYANLVKIEGDLVEAASDLGAPPFVIFLTVILPLSMPGVIAGSLLVFVPAIGEFVIPALLGGPDTLMIGRVLWDEFFANRDWPVASTVAIIMLVLVVAPIMALRRLAPGEHR